MPQWIHVWQHFSVNSSDSSRVNCKICNKSIARGGKQATAFNTSNMRTQVITTVSTVNRSNVSAN